MTHLSLWFALSIAEDYIWERQIQRIPRDIQITTWFHPNKCRRASEPLPKSTLR